MSISIIGIPMRTDCTVGIRSVQTITRDTLDCSYSLPPAFWCHPPTRSAAM